VNSSAASMFLLAAASLIFTRASAQNFVEPTDAELRSVYCLKMLRSQLEMAKPVLAQRDAAIQSAQTPEAKDFQTKLALDTRKSVAEIERAVDRLQAYLLPRFMSRDPVAMIAAQKRADADWHALWEASGRCLNECPPPTSADDPKTRACLQSCDRPEIREQLNACKNPSWLPF
jgi:hypothetical protein